MTDEPDPLCYQWVTFDPLPEFAEAIGLPDQRWYCALVVLDGEPWTGITTDQNAMDTLMEMNSTGRQPPEEWGEWAGNQFVTRHGWPVHWYQGYTPPNEQFVQRS